MAEFVHRIRRLLDRRTKQRIVLAAAAAGLLATIEAAAIAMVLPLVQAVSGVSDGEVPESASWLADRLDDPSPERVAITLGLLTFGLFLAKGVLAVAYLRWSFGFLMRSEADTARRLLHAYLHAPYTFHLEHNSAELQRTINVALRKVYRESLVSAIGGFADLVIIVGVAAVLVVYEPGAALGSVAYFAVVGVGYQRVIHRQLRRASSEIHDQSARSYQLIQQSVSAAKELTLSHRQDHFVDDLHRTERAMGSRVATLLLLSQAPRFYLEIALMIGVGLLSFSVFRSQPTDEAVAVLGLFLAAGFRLLPSLNRILVALSAIRTGMPSLVQITDDLERLAPDAMGASGPATGPRLGGRLVLEDVVFRYDTSSAPVLQGVSLAVDQGTSVGVVGASGSGKTTLLDVILGLLEPESGSVTLDGRPLATARRDWQQSIGYVPQSVALLDDTLRANIAFGYADEEIDLELLDTVVEQAELVDVVQRLPRGLDTEIGEGGTRLSGGQRQRIGIARALYHRPSVLVLDEATSALDSETEARIARTVESLHGHLTVLIVAHRLSTVRRCDRLFFLEGGRIAAEGTFEELLDASTSFASFVHLSQLQAHAGTEAGDEP